MMLYNLYLQSKWRKETDTSEEISHIRWYTDVFRLVSWFFQLFHQTLIPHLLPLGWRVSEKVWGAAASSFIVIKTCQCAGKLTKVNEKIKFLQGHILPKLSLLSSCVWLETVPKTRMSCPSVPGTVPAVRHLLEKMQNVIISQKTLPSRLSVGQLSWAMNTSCNSDLEQQQLPNKHTEHTQAVRTG